jgi:electron transfer flavoprotein beta subunit
MGMQIIVCIKQVPDTAEMKKVQIHAERGTLVREGIPSILNPFDEYALEEAVRIKEKLGGKVTVLSMGPAQAEDALRKGLSMGADEAVLLCDRAFAGADTLATAYTLSAAIKKIGPFDLVLCGQQAIDGDTGQVGPSLAEHLHVPQVTYVDRIEVEGQNLKVRREVEGGYEELHCPLPALLTVVKGINEPRIPTFSCLAEALEREIHLWTAADLAARTDRIGLEGSPTWVVRIWTPEPRRNGQVIECPPAEAAQKLASFLRQKGILS